VKRIAKEFTCSRISQIFVLRLESSVYSAAGSSADSVKENENSKASHKITYVEGSSSKRARATRRAREGERERERRDVNAGNGSPLSASKERRSYSARTSTS